VAGITMIKDMKKLSSFNNGIKKILAIKRIIPKTLNAINNVINDNENFLEN
jgi:hypothetical protein